MSGPTSAAPLVTQLLSGGQTGVDRAALDVALALGLPHGGWCPQGRRAEDGALDARYRLTETPSRSYRQRTVWNVRDADATLIVNLGPLEGGTAATLAAAQRLGKPCLMLQLDELQPGQGEHQVRQWLESRPAGTLNVAGPREAKRPGIYEATAALLRHALAPGQKGEAP